MTKVLKLAFIIAFAAVVVAVLVTVLTRGFGPTITLADLWVMEQANCKSCVYADLEDRPIVLRGVSLSPSNSGSFYEIDDIEANGGTISVFPWGWSGSSCVEELAGRYDVSGRLGASGSGLIVHFARIEKSP